MKNYKLIISYDGTNFHGFQIQKDKTTVQGEFQKALEIFTKKYELISRWCFCLVVCNSGFMVFINKGI